jgi:hypothetical protein
MKLNINQLKEMKTELEKGNFISFDRYEQCRDISDRQYYSLCKQVENYMKKNK